MIKHELSLRSRSSLNILIVILSNCSDLIFSLVKFVWNADSSERTT